MAKIKYNRIGAVMVDKDMKSGELASYVGVTVHTVSRWRTNDQQPSLKDLFKIALFLHVKVGDLLAANELPEVPVRGK